MQRTVPILDTSQHNAHKETAKKSAQSQPPPVGPNHPWICVVNQKNRALTTKGEGRKYTAHEERYLQQPRIRRG